MSNNPQKHDPVQTGRQGALKSWAQTPNRAKRTANARKKSPSSLEYHLDRLDQVLFAESSQQDKIAAALIARKLYFSNIARKRYQPKNNESLSA
jgi:hypothetical protein